LNKNRVLRESSGFGSLTVLLTGWKRRIGFRFHNPLRTKLESKNNSIKPRGLLRGNGLNNEADQRAVASAAETAGVNVSRQLAGLGRGEAIIFGAALPVPTRLAVSRPNPEPDSKDPPFLQEWSA